MHFASWLRLRFRLRVLSFVDSTHSPTWHTFFSGISFRGNWLLLFTRCVLLILSWFCFMFHSFLFIISNALDVLLLNGSIACIPIVDQYLRAKPSSSSSSPFYSFGLSNHRLDRRYSPSPHPAQYIKSSLNTDANPMYPLSLPLMSDCYQILGTFVDLSLNFCLFSIHALSSQDQDSLHCQI